MNLARWLSSSAPTSSLIMMTIMMIHCAHGFKITFWVGSGFVYFECPKMFLRSLNGIWGWIGFCGQICRQPTRPSDLHRIRDSKSLLIFRSWQPRQACRSVKALTTVFTESNIPKYSCLKYDDDDDADIYIGDKDLMKIIIWGALKESDIWVELLLGFSSLKCGSGSGCFW